MSAAPDATPTAGDGSPPNSQSSTASEGTGLRGLITAAAPIVGALFVAAVYALTAAPGAWWGDGLELTAAASVLGIAHPPGYPLYTVLGHLLIRVLGGVDPGRLMALVSAGLCASSAALIGLTAFRVLRGNGDARLPGETGAGLSHGPAAFIALGATLAAGFSYTIWDHATYAEVYPLTLALVCAMTLVAVGPGGAGEAPGVGRVVLLAILSGLSALNHYSAVAAAPLVVLTVIMWGRHRNRMPLYVAVLVGIFAISLSGYAYLPWRASQNPPLNFGNPDSFAGLLWMLRGGQYGQLFLPGASGLAAQAGQGIGRWTAWWGEQVLGPGRPGAATGLGAVLALSALGGQALLARRRFALGAGALTGMITTLMFSILYRIPDIEGFFLPAAPMAALGWMELARRMAGLPSRPLARQAAGVTLGVALTLGALGLLITHSRGIDKSWDRGPEAWADGVFAALPEGSLILTRQGYDSEIYALWYAQMVGGKRPDVTVFGTGFIFSGWYGRYFEAEGRPKVPVFVTDRPPGTKEVYDIALIGGVIVPNLRERRVFTTFLDPTLEQYFAPRAVAELLPAEYYDATAYKLNPPGRTLYELRRNLQIEPIATQRFVELFGREAGT
jgi:hypothetical protein